MKILKCKAQNFGSYKNVEFDFESAGLSLIYGPTGSGKSTLQDLVPWALYGVTSKDGLADDVRNWSGNEPTLVSIDVRLQSKTITVTRIRGESNQNDLYWTEGGSKLRGKDLNDTQKLLDTTLGVNAETYCTMSCFNEFSSAGQFFLAKAKERRLLFERIAFLDLPVLLAEKSALKKKEVKKDIEEAKKELAKALGKLEQLQESKIASETYLANWNTAQNNTVEDLKLKSKFFDKEKKSKVEALKTKSFRFEADKKTKTEELVDRLDAIDQKIDRTTDFDNKIEEANTRLLASNRMCPTCKRPNTGSKLIEDAEKAKKLNTQYLDKFSEISQKIKEIQRTKNPYTGLITITEDSQNHYEAQIESAKTQANPFIVQLQDISANLLKAVSNKLVIEAKIGGLEYKHHALTRIYDLSFQLRKVMMRKVVNRIELDVNHYLTEYFDSEFSVNFNLDDGDNLDLDIKKNGHICSYSQLSKGQRQLLRLSFSVAVMKASADNAGADLNLLMFDEATDGCDNDIKIKSFRLFEQLSLTYPSVLVIDHSEELKSMFSSRYRVEMCADESFVNHE